MSKPQPGQMTGGAGTDDNDVVFTLHRADSYDAFNLQSTAGAMDVFVSFDGTNFATAPLSLTDLGAASSVPVLVTAANRTYGFRVVGARSIVVRQNGVTAVENACLSYGTM